MCPSDAAGPSGALLQVDPIALELGDRFRAAGHRLYLVGGAVRDLLLGRSSRGEMDFATDARPEGTLHLLQGWAEARFLAGVRFGTVGAVKGDRRLEITTFRKEVYRPDDRHPMVTFSDELEEDLSRRDFTVNAMAVRLPEREFVDPFGGVRALAARSLDTPLDPEVAFEDDPLRMLRAARFTATLHLTPAPRVLQAIRGMNDRLAIVSAERIRDELSRLLVEADRPSLGLALIVGTGLAERFLPELPGLEMTQDPVHRHKDVLRHTMAVVDRCLPDLVLRLAGLLHDVGKPSTRTFSEDGVQFHHHEVVGARMAEQRLRALRYPGDVVSDVTKLVEMHLRFHNYQSWTDASVRRYVRDAGPLLDRLNELTRADCTTGNRFKARALAALQDDLELRIARLAEQENLQQLRPPIDGNQIMAHLDIPPGPMVGEAWRFLLEERIERGPMGVEEAYALLDGWWANRGPSGGPSPAEG